MIYTPLAKDNTSAGWGWGWEWGGGPKDARMCATPSENKPAPSLFCQQIAAQFCAWLAVALHPP